jgi:hypothetical protein
METAQAPGPALLRSVRTERESFFPSLSGPRVEIGGRAVGEDEPVFVIA